MKLTVICILWSATLFVALVVTDKITVNLDGIKNDTLQAIGSMAEKLQADLPETAGKAGEEFGVGLLKSPIVKVKNDLSKAKEVAADIHEKANPIAVLDVVIETSPVPPSPKKVWESIF